MGYFFNTKMQALLENGMRTKRGTMLGGDVQGAEIEKERELRRKRRSGESQSFSPLISAVSFFDAADNTVQVAGRPFLIRRLPRRKSE